MTLKDEMCSFDKATEAIGGRADRFIGASAVPNPLRRTEAFLSLEAQVDGFGGKILGLKMYPSSWTSGP